MIWYPGHNPLFAERFARAACVVCRLCKGKRSDEEGQEIDALVAGHGVGILRVTTEENEGSIPCPSFIVTGSMIAIQLLSVKERWY